MKKVLLMTVLCVFNYSILKAQTNKGKVFIGVSSTFKGFSVGETGSDLMTLGFSSEKVKSDADGFEESDSYKTTSFNLLPKVGYFVIDNLAVGLDISIASSTTKIGTDNDKFVTTMLGISPFARYYIPTEKVLPFFEVGGTYGSITTKYSYNNSENKSSSNANAFWAGVGMAVPLGDRVTFDVMAGYNSLTIKDKEYNEDNYRTVLGTLGLKLGVIVFLVKKVE